MKLILICVGAISVCLIVGFTIGYILPTPINIILCAVAGWCFGWYTVSPIIIEELGYETGDH